MKRRVGVGVVGCGLIGRRRALEAARDERSWVVSVADPRDDAALSVAEATGAQAADDWRRVVQRADVDVVIVATPNAFLAEIASAALEGGKHVLMEKPMGRNLEEARAICAAAARSGRVLKVGFNHRYHPALADARRRWSAGEFGGLVNIRARYGHGARPGYEQEWRGDAKLAGGGELTDQGIHLLDLIHWFGGVPQYAFAYLQTAVWPMGNLEDNAFGLLRFPAGAVALLHASLTQWKNLFSFEVFGDLGSLCVDGLGRSYGPETLTLYHRAATGGPPTVDLVTYGGEDDSWRMEWVDFLKAVLDGHAVGGTAEDGLVAMRMLDALYRSAARHAPVEV
jgi:predicted dehydrogenase